MTRTITVWAPRASGVDVVVGGQRHPMKLAGGGWWSAELELAHGTDYAFLLNGGESVDGEEQLPDPKSAWQPAGVHGPSRYVDHSEFAWQATGWRGKHITGLVGYELHIGTFTNEGTFDAAIDHLHQLVDLGVDLGVDFVEVMPVAAFPGRNGWGYDGVFPYAVQDSYGGPDGFKRFVDACHSRELAVLLDVVYNHLGPDGNVLPRYGPYFTDSYATPWGKAVNFSGADSDDVRRYFLDNALMWLRDYRLDGLRLDAVHAIIDTSATHLLEQMAVEVTALSSELGRPLTIVAESDLNDPRIVAPHEIGGYGVDAQWSDDFHHALHAALTGETFGYYEDFGNLADVATALRNGYVYNGQHSSHRRRRHGRRLPSVVTAQQLFGYSQNHDQVGNRARGERLCHLVSPAMAKVGAAIVLLSPFTPLLFMGEEWAASTPWQYFTEHDDAQLVESIRNGRRNEFKSFGWEPEEVPDPQDPQTSRRSVLDWAERDRAPHHEMLEWYRALISLRREFAELRDGGFETLTADVDEKSRVLVMKRPGITVVANLSPQQRRLAVSASRVLLASSSDIVLKRELTMPGESVVILGD
ncbi:MAG: malto-oligosyltrehalose trehalohydrolase [Acidothermaceae bacterium]